MLGQELFSEYFETGLCCVAQSHLQLTALSLGIQEATVPCGPPPGNFGDTCLRHSNVLSSGVQRAPGLCAHTCPALEPAVVPVCFDVAGAVISVPVSRGLYIWQLLSVMLCPLSLSCFLSGVFATDFLDIVSVFLLLLSETAGGL